MATDQIDHAGPARRGRSAPPGRAPGQGAGVGPLPDPEAAAGRGRLDRRPRGHRAQRRHPPPGGRHRDRQLPRGGRDLPARRRRRPGLPGPLRAGHVPRSSSRRPRRAPSPSVARNPARSVVIGDPHMVLVPTYGSPFIHNLDDGRRYATIEDFRNFVKLTYTSHDPAPRRRDAVRAGRPAGQQAPLRHGLQPHPLLRPGVHGLGRPIRAARRTRSTWRRSCSAPRRSSAST